MAACNDLRAPVAQVKPDRSHRQYAFVLCLIACLTVSTQLLLDYALRLHHNETSIVAALGGQRAAAQQLASAALVLGSDAGRTRPGTHRASLLRAAEKWDAGHRALREDVYWLAGKGEAGSDIVARLKRLNISSRALRADAAELNRLSDPAQSSPITARAISATLEKIVSSEATFTRSLETISDAFKESYGRRLFFLHKVGLGMVSSTLLLLLFLFPAGFFQQVLFAIRTFFGLGRLDGDESLGKGTELILNAAGEGIWGVDQEGRTTFVNPAAAQMVGWDIDELSGAIQHDVLRHSGPGGVEYPKDRCPICQSLEVGSVHHRSDDVFWRKDNTYFPVEYHSTPIWENKEIVGAVITFRNIQEQCYRQTQLVQAQKLESIGQLAAGIAHEINTPTQYVGDNTRFLKDAFAALNEAASLSETLARAAEDGPIPDDLRNQARSFLDRAELPYLQEEVPKAIEQSLEGIARVTKIVRAMKDFSHPGGDRKTSADINAALQSTITVSRNEWKYVADMVTDFDPELPAVPCLIGDLNQVVLNLIVNAAHAIADVVGDGEQSKGAITVTTKRRGEWAEIRVTDTGTGIPESVRSRVFDPFFTTKKVGKGTGQGLAICYSVIVEKHRGSISLETEVGRGTTFIIRLPLRDTAEHEES